MFARHAPLAVAILVLFLTPQSLPAPDTNGIQMIAGKNCRLVDMCWFKNGKRMCFKKRVCD